MRPAERAGFHVISVLALVAWASATRAAVWDQYNLAPASRTIGPVSVFKTNGNVINPNNVLSGQATAIVGSGAYITLDFGKEVGGYATLTFAAASDTAQSVGIAFSESSLYVGVESDQSSGAGTDGALTAAVPGASTYTVPRPYLRGGFRYLTVFLRSGGWVHLSGVSLAYSPDPNRAVPNQYPNYFYSNDDMLNRAWYAGAYTFQTNIVRNNEGRAWPPPAALWDNGSPVGEFGNVVLTDGAKRDRTVWPGDMGIAVPTGYVALFDTVSARNSLQTIYNHQAASGELPFSGPMFNLMSSDTYHMWTLFGTHAYYLYSGDKAWLDSIWARYQLGVTFISNKIDANGLLNVTGTNDWARDGQGGENVEANALLYGVLTRGAYLAQIEGDANLSSTYSTRAASLKTQINSVLWDTSTGSYKDNPTSTLHPQDGNALAAWLGVVDSPAKAKSISYALNENWNDKGSRGPEFTIGSGVPKISTFASSMELMGHFEAGYAGRGLDMIRSMWGYMLNASQGPQSTFWEGLNSDGSFAYQGAFQSNSHGWGSGPTSALTFYVLGLAPETVLGQTYHVIPHPGNLTHVEGNLTMASGKVVATHYDVGASCGTFSLYVDAQSHTGSTGRIGVPRYGANHTVLVNGATAWNGTSFVATSGIAGASQDADYIYFTGVQPGVRTFSFTDGASCGAPAEQWTFCSDEAGTCSFSGTKRVRYGKQGKYNYGLFSGSVGCNNTALGPDPIAGVAKSCQYSSELYTACASENATCSFSGTKQVRFGANGQWVTQTATGSIACNIATFGDPLANVLKTCEYRDPVATPTSTATSTPTPTTRATATPTSTPTPTATPTATATGGGSVVSLSSTFNVNAAYTDGTTFSATGGLDGVGSAYSSTLLGTSLTWSGTTFNFGAANQLNGVRNTTVTLPAGQFATLMLLGAGINGDQASQTVKVNYTDGTSSTFTQTFSNWLNASQNVAGQSIALTMAYRNKSTGVKDSRAFNLYGYSFALTSTKTVSSIVLPANNNVSILAAALRTAAVATPTATATPTRTATPTSTPTATPTSGGGQCAGIPAFATCTAYPNGSKVVFNNTLYHTIADVPAMRDCPPSSPFDPSNDNWWVNDGGC
jgi:hypothetical protein